MRRSCRARAGPEEVIVVLFRHAATISASFNDEWMRQNATRAAGRVRIREVLLAHAQGVRSSSPWSAQVGGEAIDLMQ